MYGNICIEIIEWMKKNILKVLKTLKIRDKCMSLGDGCYFFNGFSFDRFSGSFS